MKLWGGRFKHKTNKLAEAYSASLVVDQRLAEYDCLGSIAWAKALAKARVLSKTDAARIISGLILILKRVKTGKIRFSGAEDVHTAVEEMLFRLIGSSAGRLHTGRSRNDQVALDLRMCLIDEISCILGRIHELENVMVHLAKRHFGVVVSGFTHLQHAQPVLLSHHFLAYFEMLERDKARLHDSLKRIKIMPLGSGALAGTSFNIDRDFLCKELGFLKPSANSMDAVSDRDFVAEFLACSAVIMMHLSRLSEELVLWSMPEFGYITFSDAFTTGSSMMPQKKNPDIAELIRAKTGRVYGNLLGFLAAMKGIPLSYNRDLQEDKKPVFDTVDTVKSSLEVMAEMLKEMTVNRKQMQKQAETDFSLATDIADYLVNNGMEFRKAHKLTGKIVLYCIKCNKRFCDLTSKEWGFFSKLFKPDIALKISADSSIAGKRVFGGTAPEKVKNAIRRAIKLVGMAFVIAVLYTMSASALNSNVGTTSANFLKIAPGARAAALGESYVAVADDSSALYWNPAGLALLTGPDALAMHLFWFAESNYDYIAYAQPVADVGIGVSITYFGAGTIDAYSSSGEQVSTFSAYDLCANMGAGTRLFNISHTRELLGGINVKYIRQAIEKSSGSGVAFDLGLMAPKLIGRFSFGLNVQNIGTKIKLGDEASPLPFNVRFGTTADVSELLRIMADLNFPVDNNVRAGVGFESNISFISARLGYFYRFGSLEYSNALAGLTAGIGVTITTFGLDYTFAPYGNLGLTHRIAVFARFGEKVKTAPAKTEVTHGM